MRSSMSASGSLIQQQPQDLTRKRPKVTRLDLEKMFQDSIELCSEYNRLLKENGAIKQELSKVDVVISMTQTLRSQRQTLICSVQGVISEKSKDLKPELKSSSWLVFKLKKQIHFLKKQIEQKDKVIADFSKDKYNEILREKQDEKNCMESLLNTLKIPSDQPNPKLDELYQLRQYQNSQRQKIQQLQNELEVEERQVKKLISQITHQKLEAQRILQQQEELKMLQAVHRKSCSGDTMNLPGGSKDKKKVNQQTVAELEAIKDSKNQQIKELENTIEKIIQREKVERKKLQAEYAALAEKLEKASEKAPKIRISVPHEPVPVSQTEQKECQVLVNKVRPNHIAQVGRFLRFNLAVKRFTHQHWKRELFPNEQQQTVSIRSLTQSLQKQPFEITDFEQARLLARYLVEDDLNEKLYFNEKLTQTLPIVKSILEKVIGQIKIYSPEEEQIVLAESSTILSKYRGLVIPGLQAKAQKSPFLRQKDIIEVIDGCMLDLTSAHLDYIILYLFSFSKKLNQLRFMDIEKLGVTPLNYSQ